MKRIGWVIGLIIVIIIALGLIVLSLTKKSSPPRSPLPHLKIGTTQIPVEIADTPEAQVQGLSDRDSIQGGMVFYYPTSQVREFWMKDMRFPLDILWVQNGRIISITENAQPAQADTPDEQIPRFKPTGPINSVVEVNAGFSKQAGINVDDTVQFSEPSYAAKYPL